MRVIGRILWVAIAFGLATAVGIMVAGWIGLELLTKSVAAAAPNDDTIGRWFAAYDRLTAVLPAFRGVSALPTVALVIVGEVLRLRSFLYYIVGGGLAAAAIPMLAGPLHLDGDPGTATATVLQTLAVGGFAAGATYWLLAGRSA